MKDKRMLIIGGLAAILLIAIPLTVYIANQQQDVRSRADQGANTLIADTGATATPLPTSTPLAATSTATPSPSPTVSTAVPSPTPTAVGAATPTTATGTITPTTAGACAVPDVVSNVEFNYPSCAGTQCNFTEASCSWAAVNGATSYSVKITQVDSGTITSTNSVTSPGVTFSFPVEQGKTYRCDISAVSTCGTSGPAGSAQELCAVDGQVGSPVPTTRPQVIPTVVPTGDVSTTMLVGFGGLVVAIIGGLLFFFSGV